MAGPNRSPHIDQITGLRPIQDSVAEGLWQAMTGADPGIAGYEAWLALSDTDKVPWWELARSAIASWWVEVMGQQGPPPEYWPLY